MRRELRSTGDRCPRASYMQNLHMAFFPDLGTETMVASGAHVRAIGWLAAGHAFPTGTVPGVFTERLQRFMEGGGKTSQFEMGLGLCLGWHDCEFCGQFRGRSAFVVPSESGLYVCPEMLEHYVTVHDYLPPPAFVDAVMRSPLPGTDEYERLAVPFVEAHSRKMLGVRERLLALKRRTSQDPR